jgi:arylsulfatase A-like enzyme
MKHTLQILAVLILMPLAALHAADAPEQKPNILYIVADDMGYADCGVHGSKDVPTPHIDSIAKQGIRFTDAYVTGPVCSPTRASLMTGRYHNRDGVHRVIAPGGPGLNPGVPTVADYLKSAGYRTGIVGKWHLGEAPDYHPLKRGFDEFYGTLGGARSYFPDASGIVAGGVGDTRILRGNEPVELKEYATVAFGREAVEFIQRQKDGSQPFFLYLAFTAPHAPMHAMEEDLARFSGIEDKRRRTYAAMMAAMDDAIGRVLAAVREAGFENNTLICFLSDNGGAIKKLGDNASKNTPLRGAKGQTWEGGIRVPMFVKWAGHLKPGTYSQPVINMDLTATILALAGVTPDAKWPIDGVNLMPFLEGKPGEPHPMLCWDYGGQWAIRQGRWKLVSADPGEGEKKPAIELYDLAQDIGEQNDLSAQHPELVKQLQSDWQAWRKEVVVKKPAASAGPKNHADTP